MKKEKVTILKRTRQGKSYIRLAKDRLFITTMAFEAIGQPDYVKVGHFKSPPAIMLLSAKKSDRDARKVLVHQKIWFISVTHLIKEIPKGKYYHSQHNLFQHEAHYKPKESSEK